MSARSVQSACAVFREVAALRNHEVAERIAADAVDLLMEFNGYWYSLRCNGAFVFVVRSSRWWYSFRTRPVSCHISHWFMYDLSYVCVLVPLQAVKTPRPVAAHRNLGAATRAARCHMLAFLSRWARGSSTYMLCQVCSLVVLRCCLDPYLCWVFCGIVLFGRPCSALSHCFQRLREKVCLCLTRIRYDANTRQIVQLLTSACVRLSRRVVGELC